MPPSLPEWSHQLPVSWPADDELYMSAHQPSFNIQHAARGRLLAGETPENTWIKEDYFILAALQIRVK